MVATAAGSLEPTSSSAPKPSNVPTSAAAVDAAAHHGAAAAAKSDGPGSRVAQQQQPAQNDASSSRAPQGASGACRLGATPHAGGLAGAGAPHAGAAGAAAAAAAAAAALPHVAGFYPAYLQQVLASGVSQLLAMQQQQQQQQQHLASARPASGTSASAPQTRAAAAAPPSSTLLLQQGEVPAFKATNPSHASFCGYCKTSQTSGCWRRGWLIDDNIHINLCNKCGLRYKHGRLPNAPAPPPPQPTAAQGAGAVGHRGAAPPVGVVSAATLGKAAHAAAAAAPGQVALPPPAHQLLPHLQHAAMHAYLQQQQQQQQPEQQHAVLPGIQHQPQGGAKAGQLHPLPHRQHSGVSADGASLTVKPGTRQAAGAVAAADDDAHGEGDDPMAVGSSSPVAGGPGSSGTSDEELPVKRPCSRTSHNAALALMELNSGNIKVGSLSSGNRSSSDRSDGSGQLVGGPCGTAGGSRRHHKQSAGAAAAAAHHQPSLLGHVQGHAHAQEVGSDQECAMPGCEAKTGSGGGGSSCSEAGMAVVVATPIHGGPGQAQAAPWGGVTSAAARTAVPAGPGPGSSSIGAGGCSAKGGAQLSGMRRSPSGSGLAAAAAAPAGISPPMGAAGSLAMGPAVAPLGLPPTLTGMQPGPALLPAVPAPNPQVPGLPLAPQMGMPPAMAAFPGMHYGFMPGYAAGYTLEQLGMLHSMTAAACFPYPAAALYQTRSMGLAGNGAPALQATASAQAQPSGSAHAGGSSGAAVAAGAMEAAADVATVKQEPAAEQQASDDVRAQQHAAQGDALRCHTSGKSGPDEGEMVAPAAPPGPQQHLFCQAAHLSVHAPQQDVSSVMTAAAAVHGFTVTHAQHGERLSGSPQGAEHVHEADGGQQCEAQEARGGFPCGNQGADAPGAREGQGLACHARWGPASALEHVGDQQRMALSSEGCPTTPPGVQGDGGGPGHVLDAPGTAAGGSAGPADCSQVQLQMPMEGGAGSAPGASDAGTWTVAQVNAWLHTIGAEELVQPFALQRIDGVALLALYRTGSSSLDTLHSLVRAEFGSVRLGQRLRLVEGLCDLFGHQGQPGPATCQQPVAASS